MRILSVMSFDAVRRAVPTLKRAPLALSITAEAIEALRDTVGAEEPETGAKLFGPKDREGVDLVEFDVRGSSRASRTVYAPDTEWADERNNFWLDQADERDVRLSNGFVHSHPGHSGVPSPPAGKGLGDLGYVRELLEAFAWTPHFYLPIVTGAGSEDVRLWPWVVLRERPGEAMYCDVDVVDADEFPKRYFDPGWLATLGQDVGVDAPNPLIWNVPISLLTVAEVAGAGEVAALDQGFVFRDQAAVVHLSLPPGFPAVAPIVEVGAQCAMTRLPFTWLTSHPCRLEDRLGWLVRHAFTIQSREF